MVRYELLPFLHASHDGFAFETENFLLAARHGFQIEFVPIRTIYGDERSKIKPMRDAFRYLRLLAKYPKREDFKQKNCSAKGSSWKEILAEIRSRTASRESVICNLSTEFAPRQLRAFSRSRSIKASHARRRRSSLLLGQPS